MLKLECVESTRKIKGSWSARGQNGLLPIVTEKVCRDRASWALCRNRLFLVETGCAGQAHD